MKLAEKIAWKARLKSPWIIHFNSGGCNGCDIEIVDMLTPRHDIEQYGMLLKGTPRQADILVCTGPVTVQVAKRLKRIYEQMPEPKFVVAIGNCATTGGVFQECPFVMGGIDKILPVSAWVYGCPPRPEAMIAAIAKLLAKAEEDMLGIKENSKENDNRNVTEPKNIHEHKKQE